MEDYIKYETKAIIETFARPLYDPNIMTGKENNTRFFELPHLGLVEKFLHGSRHYKAPRAWSRP